MRGRRKGGVAIAALALAGLVAAGGGSSAVAGSAGTTCAYAESGPAGPRGNYLQVHQPAPSGIVTISRSGRRIMVSERGTVGCTGRAATVDNVDRIFLLSDSSRRLVLNMRTGGLGPGASEKGAGADIEVFLRVAGGSGRQPVRLTVLAGKGPNVVTFGRAAGSEQFNLNARRERLDDTDVYIESIDYSSSLFLSGLGAGENTIDGRGPGRLRPSMLTGWFHIGPGDNRIYASSGGGSHLHTDEGSDLLVAGPNGDTLIGRAGRDRLLGANGVDRMSPGPGRDFVDAGRGDDLIGNYDDDVDTIDCGPGNDTARAGEEDILRDCENVTRS